MYFINAEISVISLRVKVPSVAQQAQGVASGLICIKYQVCGQGGFEGVRSNFFLARKEFVSIISLPSLAICIESRVVAWYMMTPKTNDESD